MKLASLLNAGSLIAALASAIEPWWRIELKVLILGLVTDFTYFQTWGLQVVSPRESKSFFWLSPEGVSNMASKLGLLFAERSDILQWLYLVAFLSFALGITMNVLQLTVARDTGHVSYASTLFYGIAISSFVGAVNWFCSRLFIPLQGERYIPVHPHAVVSWGFGNGFFIILLALGLRTLLHVIQVERSSVFQAHTEAAPLRLACAVSGAFPVIGGSVSKLLFARS